MPADVSPWMPGAYSAMDGSDRLPLSVTAADTQSHPVRDHLV